MRVRRQLATRKPSKVHCVMPKAAALSGLLILGTLALITGAVSNSRHTRGAERSGIVSLGVPDEQMMKNFHTRTEVKHEPPQAPRRALKQIARESEQGPFDFLPGASGPGPTNWMLRDASREIPASVAKSVLLNSNNAHDAVIRSLSYFLPTTGQLILLPTTIARVTATPWDYLALLIGLENSAALLSAIGY